MPDDNDDTTPSPALLDAMSAVATEMERMAVLLDSVSARWRQVAQHLRAGALPAALVDQVVANRDSAVGGETAEFIQLMFREAMDLQPKYAERAIRQAAIIDYRAKFALVTSADVIRANIEHHGSVCDDRDCFIMPLLEERLAVLAPH